MEEDGKHISQRDMGLLKRIWGNIATVEYFTGAGRVKNTIMSS